MEDNVTAPFQRNGDLEIRSICGKIVLSYALVNTWVGIVPVPFELGAETKAKDALRKRLFRSASGLVSPMRSYCYAAVEPRRIIRQGMK